MTIHKNTLKPNGKNKITQRLGMVGWYDPMQLLRTGTEVAVSTLFSKHSDSRRLDGVACAPPLIDYNDTKYLDEDGSFGFDFTADTGDGWNSTYAVAYSISQPSLNISNHSPLPHGRLLILGGDLVYPYPTRELYENRLVAPYELAGELLRDQSAEILAIPGNHDWYDSLVNFRKLFCTKDKLFGLRKTRQTRSYFAACLPGKWWVLGLDLQLEGDIDELQFEFFCGVIEKKLENDDLVILCIPEPVWHKRWELNNSETKLKTLLEELEDKIGNRLRMSIAGDLHHYQRHSTSDNKHKITCGMGGAFLHPTHNMPEDTTGEFEHKKSFPSQETSRHLAFKNINFLALNPMFGILTAITYLLASWQNGLAVGECFGKDSVDVNRVCIKEMGMLDFGFSNFGDAIIAGIHSALLNPIGVAFYALIFAGFYFFTVKLSTHKFRGIIGIMHAAFHIFIGFCIYWFSVYIAIHPNWLELAPKSILQYLTTGSLIIFLSWVLGSCIIGIYLLVSINLLKTHQNEAFSSLSIEDWKGFLRFRIDKEGTLHMKVIGFERVPRKWRSVPLNKEHNIDEPEEPASFVVKVIDEVKIPVSTKIV